MSDDLDRLLARARKQVTLPATPPPSVKPRVDASDANDPADDTPEICAAVTEQTGRRHKQSDAAEPTTPTSAHNVPARNGWEIIRDYFIARYQPAFKVSDSLYSSTELREVRRVEACAALPPDLIETLRKATDYPCDASKNLKGPEAAPAFFRKWAGTAWVGLLAELPDEDSAALGTAATDLTKEKFTRLVREALLTPYVIARESVVGRGKDAHTEVTYPKYPVAVWCQMLAKPGQWKDVRNLKCWCKTVTPTPGEVVYRIALRHELFAQIKADRRLCEIGATKFNFRCGRYGIGKPGGQADRPHGNWAVILDDQFVTDLLGSVDVEQDF